MVIGMLGKELLDLGAVGLELMLEHAQHPRAGERQSALGAGEHFARDELAGPGEDLQAFGVGLRPRQLVAVEELFPFAFAGRPERLQGWERLLKRPRLPAASSPRRLRGPPDSILAAHSGVG